VRGEGWLHQRQRLQAAGDQLMPPGREPRSFADKSIGMKIRARRMMLGLTLQQFGELLGVSYQRVYKYERGINSMSAGQLYELAQGSGTPVEYFFEGLETNERQPLPRQKWLFDVMVSLGEIQDEAQRAAIGHLVRSLSRVSRAARRSH